MPNLFCESQVREVVHRVTGESGRTASSNARPAAAPIPQWYPRMERASSDHEGPRERKKKETTSLFMSGLVMLPTGQTNKGCVANNDVIIVAPTRV